MKILGVRLGVVFLLGWAGISIRCETLTLPQAKRPEWLRRDGIVMAGSWEPLIHRVRRDGSKGYEPTPEQRAAYAREQSPEMVADLKALGVNFVMMHAYKGYGLETERESMADAVRFSKLCHDAGLHVGVYNYSGAFGWELFFKEHPEARQWVVLDEAARPLIYDTHQFRYFWNRNHPDAQAFYKKVVRIAVEDIRADLLHFDNYGTGPGFDANSAERFRKYLTENFSAGELKQMGVSNQNSVYPPMNSAPNNLFRRAWKNFTCQSLADSYADMTRYARSLRKDILVDCNPPPPSDRIRHPVDHGRILPGGDAFWNEAITPGYSNGVLTSHIRTYKIGRAYHNPVVGYTRSPLEAAEAMAFNLDCLGCVCWFEYGKIVRMPGAEEPMPAGLLPFIRFYNTNRNLFRETTAVADVAVLRSFSSQVLSEPKWAQLMARVEQALIENRVPFQTIYDSKLADLKPYRAVVLAGCVALSDEQIKLLKRYLTSGGRLCVIGPVATHDEWFRPRVNPGLHDVLFAGIEQFSEDADFVSAVQKSCGGRFSFSVTAPPGLCAELTEQGSRRLVHLVNYCETQPASNVVINLVPPPGKTVKSVRLNSPEHDDQPELKFERQGESITFTVPQIDVYEVAVVEMR